MTLVFAQDADVAVEITGTAAIPVTSSDGSPDLLTLPQAATSAADADRHSDLFRHHSEDWTVTEDTDWLDGKSIQSGKLRAECDSGKYCERV